MKQLYRISHLLIWLVAFTSITGFAQTLSEDLQAIVDQALLDLDIKGLSTAVHLPDGTVWTGVSGLAGEGMPMTDEFSIPIGSVSKVITAACILKLMEEEQLSLDDSLGTWVESYPNIDGSITIRQLLNHTSGIYNYTEHPDFVVDVEADFSYIFESVDMLDYVEEPLFEPGTDWYYSNTNYHLLGYIVEAVTGQDFHEVAKNYFLTPLGLADVSLFPQEPFGSELAHVFQDAGPPYGKIDLMDYGIVMDSFLSSSWTAGAYTAKPADLSLLIKRIFDGTLLQESTVDQMIEELFYMGGNFDYGLGVMRYEIFGELELIGHGGDILYSTQAFYDRDNDFSIVIQANDMDVSSFDLTSTLLQIQGLVADAEFPSNTDELVSTANTFGIIVHPSFNQVRIVSDLAESEYKNHRLQLTNLQGQVLIDTHFSKQLNLPDLASGQYFLKMIEVNGSSTSQSFILLP